MSLTIRNTRELIDPAKLKLKMLIYALPGSGKTTFLSSVPGIGVAACETGHGKGLLSIASAGLDFVEPTSVTEFEAVCAGKVFPDHPAVGVDSLSDMTRTFIKEYALAMPRVRGNSLKRQAGVPELDDYGVMGEKTRSLLRKLLDQDKHVVVTATLRVDKPSAEEPSAAGQPTLIGPDLPGQMFLGSMAMFDLVLCLRTRSVLRDPRDAKSRYNQHYFITQSQGAFQAKNRLGIDGKSFLPAEVPFDVASGEGTFPYFLKKAREEYAKYLERKPKAA